MSSGATKIAILSALILVLLIPGAALAAEEEPYSGGDVTQTTLAPRVTVSAEGLQVSFRAAGVTGSCAWDFGDDQTGEGNPVDHTYAADGTYDVSGICGDIVLNRNVTFLAELSFTGFEVGSMTLLGLILLALGSGTVLLIRRVKAGH